MVRRVPIEARVMAAPSWGDAPSCMGDRRRSGLHWGLLANTPTVFSNPSGVQSLLTTRMVVAATAGRACRTDDWKHCWRAGLRRGDTSCGSKLLRAESAEDVRASFAAGRIHFAAMSVDVYQPPIWLGPDLARGR